MSKNNSGNTGLLLLLGALGVYLFTRASTIANLVFVPRGIAITGGAVNVVIGVQNPTSNSLSFNSLAGNLFVNGSAIGNVASFQPAVIIPNGETPVNVMVTPSILGIATDVLSMIQGNMSGGITANFQGTANIDNSAVPVNLNFT